MKNPQKTNSEKPKCEELPIEEFDGVPDWNARAWERIKARDEAASGNQTFEEQLFNKSTERLEAELLFSINQQGDAEYQRLIRAELKQRINNTDSIDR